MNIFETNRHPGQGPLCYKRGVISLQAESDWENTVFKGCFGGSKDRDPRERQRQNQLRLQYFGSHTLSEQKTPDGPRMRVSFLVFSADTATELGRVMGHAEGVLQKARCRYSGDYIE